ncbi:MAG: hypothetical protein R3B93_20025 [Bacteroidia bacterium]
MISPSVGFIPSCMLNTSDQLIISIRNWGVNAIDSIPVAYQLNGGSIVWDTLFSVLHSGEIDTLTFTQPEFALRSKHHHGMDSFPK